jgi:hypothetical protein
MKDCYDDCESSRNDIIDFMITGRYTNIYVSCCSTSLCNILDSNSDTIEFIDIDAYYLNKTNSTKTNSSCAKINYETIHFYVSILVTFIYFKL